MNKQTPSWINLQNVKYPMKQLMLGQKYAAMVAITEHEEKYMQLYI